MNKDLQIRFTETAQEEIDGLVHELGLIPLAQALGDNRANLPDEVQEGVGQLLTIILDMFSADMPDALSDPEHTLKTVSREINLGRLLKERGIFRFYRLLETEVYFDAETGESVDKEHPRAVPISLSQTLNNPTTGAPFAHDNDFIGWFCAEAHVARGLLFRRIMAIRRMVNTLDFSLEEAFNIMVSKPFAIEETIRMIAEWDKDKLVGMDPQVLLKVASKVDPQTVEEYQMLADNPEGQDELMSHAPGLIAGLLQEVAQHERAKDALDTVRHDIVGLPEISYTWVQEGNYLMATIIVKSTTDEGDEVISDMEYVPFVPDVANLHPAIKADLLKRLPIKNRQDLD